MERTNLYTLIHDLGDDYSYIALGDTSHTDENVSGLIGDLHLYRAVEAAGFGAFVREKPPEDSTYDDLIGRITEGDSIEEIEAYFDSQVAAGSDPESIVGAFASAAYGMESIYPDPRYSPELTMAINRAYQVISLSPREECGDVFLQSHWSQNPEDLKVVEETIHTGNETIAERIQAQSGGSAFIIYGDGHFNGQSDLDEMLGEESVVHIAAIGTREDGYNPFSGNDGSEPDYPEYIYVVDEDAVIPFDLDNPEIRQILDNFESRDVANITRDDYLSCLGELPEDLKAHAPERDDVTADERNAALQGNGQGFGISR